jgi:hypothetical protein
MKTTDTTTESWIACDASEGDTLIDLSGYGPARATADEALRDRTADWPSVRRIGPDGYLYVD